MKWCWLCENWLRRMNEKRNKNLLCQIGRVDGECQECLNMKIQNAISILVNTINNNSIQKLKNKQHMSWCNHHLECSNEIAVTSDCHTYFEWCFDFNQIIHADAVDDACDDWMKSAASQQWSGDDWVRIDRDEWMKKETKICCVKVVESMVSAGNGRIRKYKMQFQYCRIQ